MRQLSTTHGGHMILADFTPLEGFLSFAISLIGIISYCLKWLRDKDRASIKASAEMAQANANHAAGNSGEIEKLWAVIAEDKSTIKELRSDISATKSDLASTHRELEESKDDRRRLHEENRDLVRRIETYHADIGRLKDDNARLTAQNEQQAAQIRSLEQKSVVRSSNGQ